MKQNSYKITKEKNTGKIKGKNIDKIDGFEIKPKNTLAQRNILEVKRIKVAKPNLIEYLLLKKLYLKMESIIKMIDDNEDPSPSDLKLVLDEVERLRSVIRNNYAKFMSEEKLSEIMTKTNYILQEIGIKAIEKEDEVLRKNAGLEHDEESKSR